jgi:hypothetical protein
VRKIKKQKRIIQIEIQIEIKSLDEKIKYNPIHERYGRAEFAICPVFKRGILKEIFLYRRQQDIDESYHIDLIKLGYLKTRCFDISSWSHKTEDPKIWRNPYCKEHKCVSFWVYVPNNTNTIEFGYHFGEAISIRFVGE